MVDLTKAVFDLGKLVAEQVARRWLAARRAEAERSLSLVELVGRTGVNEFVKRDALRQFDRMGDRIAARLDLLVRQEFRGLEDHEREAALLAVADTLAAADLSDEALFAADADPVKLARRVRAELPDAPTRAGLGEPARALYELVLDECCECLVRMVQQLPAFQGRAAAETLERLSTVVDGIARILDTLPARTLDAPAGTDHDEEFRRRYLEFVSDTLDEVELFGVDVRRYRPLTTLSVAYISLSVSAEGRSSSRRTHGRGVHDLGRFRLADWRETEPDGGRVRVESALGKAPRMLIRGEAGSGKSTLLRWLAVTAARGRFTADLADWNGCVPFLIKLRSYADRPLPRPEQFLDGVADHYTGIMPPGWVHRQLASGLALVLVDGVDELTGAQRQQVRDWLRKLVRAYPEARYVVTSRPAAAAANWLEGFGSAMLEPMSPADIAAFVRQWHAAIRAAGNLPCPEAELPRYEKALLGRLAAAPHLRALATTPLLCAMLCALNLDRNTHLPRDRMGLYRAALDLLLERRDAERDVPSAREVALTAEQKTTLLQDLAWRLAESDLSEAPTGRVTDWIGLRAAQMPGVDADPATLLDHLLHRSGVIREPVAGRVDFVHRTFQEYLAAKEAAETDRLLVVAGHAHRDQWREVVIMAAGHANPGLCAELVEALLDRAGREPRHARRLKLLAAACLETARLLPPDLLRWVEGCLDELVPPRSVVEARTLAAVGEQVFRHLPRDLSGLSEAAAAATVRTAVLVNGPDVLALLAGYAADPRKRVQNELVVGWDYFDPAEYVRVVLADAPLDEGRLRLGPERQGLLPHTRQLRWLRRLEANVDDLGLLAGVPALTELTVSLDEVADLGVLTLHQTLEDLVLWYSGDEPLDLTPLRGLPHLVRLGIECRWLESLGVFTQFPGLRGLGLFYLDRVTDFTPLTRLDGLQELGLQQASHLRDLAFLARLPRLSGLFLANAPLDGGLAQVPAVAPQLREFAMSYTDWVRDLAPLAELKRLEWLNLAGCRQLADLTPLAGHPRLECLFLRQTAVRDLTPLAGLRTLRLLDLCDVPEEVDLSPLAGLRGLEVWLDKGQRVRGMEAVRGRVRVRRF